ncbi:MAG TPA: winged helix-turn-helix domain-containing protein [Bryobacteraceae bacterium]|nr:winged helix-turn-helix domain-containing protein [Bryobacteraceae bacterium]
MPTQDSEQIVRFSTFELDLQAGELRRSGVRLPVQGRPLQVLVLLLRTPGQLVTTEQLRNELWPADTFVDFEHGVRNAVARLRAVLGDNAERPRFVETLPRRGYRFIGAVATAAAQAVPATQAGQPAPPRNRWRIALVAFLCLVVLTGAATWIYHRFRGNPAGVQIQSLAVLPLENLSSDPAQDYFADGITAELITALAKINSVRVISRTSVVQYKGVHNKALPEIARELGVDAVVEGTLARTGDRVRVTAQLIEARTDRHIWADHYERSSRDLLLLENEIARAIAEQLRGKLNPQQQSRFSANAVDPAGYEAYLQGLYLWNRRTPPALEEAIRYFTEAIEKDPQFAQAYAGRADAYTVLGSWALEAMPPEEALRKARADAEKALQLDGNSAEAHTARAVIGEVYEWDWQRAEAEFQRAIALSPSYSIARQWYGHYLCDFGRVEECLAETARAHALDPAYLIAAVDVGLRLYGARRYAEAIAPIRKVLEFNPDFTLGHCFLGQVYEGNRMYPEAIAELRRAVELSGGAPRDLAALGHAYAVSGQPTEARKALEELEQLAKRKYVSNYARALISVGLGENDRALAWLERAFQKRSSWMVKLKVDPRLDPLRADARFTALMRGVGLPP